MHRSPSSFYVGGEIGRHSYYVRLGSEQTGVLLVHQQQNTNHPLQQDLGQRIGRLFRGWLLGLVVSPKTDKYYIYCGFSDLLG